MWSHFKVSFAIDYSEKIGYCYHSVNVITFCMNQSDHIKRLSLYIKCFNQVRSFPHLPIFRHGNARKASRSSNAMRKRTNRKCPSRKRKWRSPKRKWNLSLPWRHSDEPPLQVNIPERINSWRSQNQSRHPPVRKRWQVRVVVVADVADVIVIIDVLFVAGDIVVVVLMI